MKWKIGCSPVSSLYATSSDGEIAPPAGGNGPSIYDPFIALRNWVEHDIEPNSILGLPKGVAVDPGRTLPLCPFPQTYIYSGFGSTEDASSFTCGGNVQTKSVACNDVQQENTTNLDFKGVGLTAGECEAYLPPPNVGTPTSP